MGVEVKATCCGREVIIIRKDLDEDDGQDPNFFDTDYTVAGATGFTIWDGAWSLIQQVDEKLHTMFKNKKIIELGSGTGLAGICIASAGGHILLTDLQPVVEDVLRGNILMNVTQNDDKFLKPWGDQSSYVGEGSAYSKPLNWCKSVDSQLNMSDLTNLDFIVASEVVWLKELVEPFCRTLADLLQLPSRPVAIVVCRSRAKETSKTFAHLSDVTNTLTEFGCSLELISSVTGPEGAPTSTFKITLTSDERR